MKRLLENNVARVAFAFLAFSTAVAACTGGELNLEGDVGVGGSGALGGFSGSAAGHAGTSGRAGNAGTSSGAGGVNAGGEGGAAGGGGAVGGGGQGGQGVGGAGGGNAGQAGAAGGASGASGTGGTGGAGGASAAVGETCETAPNYTVSAAAPTFVQAVTFGTLAHDYTPGCGSTSLLTTDEVFSITPTGSGPLTVTLSNVSAGVRLALTARTACEDAGTQKGCASSTTPGTGASVTFTAFAGTTYFFIVTGEKGTMGMPPDASASYTIEATLTARKSVALTDACPTDGTSTLLAVGAPLAVNNGNTTTAAADLTAPQSSTSCGLIGSVAMVGPDQVVAIKTAAAGTVAIDMMVSSGYQPVIYAKTTCSNAAMANVCKAADDSQQASFSVSFAAANDTVYYIVFDSVSGSTGQFSAFISLTP